MTPLSPVERMKFQLLAHGLTMSAGAADYINEHNRGRPMTPSDYASTSGIILRLDDDVWVNAPIENYNPNFVRDSELVLDVDGDGLFVAGPNHRSRAGFWLPPSYHGTANPEGEPYNSYGFTHADRVRISPIEGCAMTCKFCDLPYEFRYRAKRVEGLLDTVRVALADDVQPAGHVLISGGTPRSADVGYVRDVYAATIGQFPDVPVDIMMVPDGRLLDAGWLDGLGVHELSINLELYSLEAAKRYMPQKFRQGRDYCLDFIANCADVLGPARVRSMLMVGLEPVESTLAGVEAIASRGAVPVLSPFRPDPSTPLRSVAPPDAEMLEDVYVRALEICTQLGTPLGPSCIPCSHNTMTFAAQGAGDAARYFGAVNLV